VIIELSNQPPTRRGGIFLRCLVAAVWPGRGVSRKDLRAWVLGCEDGLPVELVTGAGRQDRRIVEVEGLLLAYRDDSGAEYLDYEPRTPSDELLPEDLAVTSLINSRFSMDAFRSLARRGHEVDLRLMPDAALEQTTADERERIADLVATVAQWPGFAASVATKVLHKKRPRLIPILDNQAIFGAYMNPQWPQRRAFAESVKSNPRIKEALDWIAFDLTRPENATVWQRLHTLEPSRSRIQLFDSIWWMYFRQVEPVQRPTPATARAERLPTGDAGAVATDAELAVFSDDEDGYLAWLAEHPDGYVLNSYRNPSASYLKLHRAACGRIQGAPPRGTTWTRPYIKVCADSRPVVEAWALATTAGSVSPCGWCLP
jgi:hypothetical protein